MTYTIQAVLASLEAYAEEHSVPIIRKSERKALIAAARKASPARILEVGTAIGYSSLLLLREFPEAHIDTIEVDEQRYRIAEEAVEKAGVSHRWHGHLGDAARDFVFLDGPKGQYLRELKMLEPLLAGHAVIAADNVLFRGMVMAEGQVPHRYRTLVMRLRDYIRYVNSAYDTIIDEEGDGLAVSVKR